MVALDEASLPVKLDGGQSTRVAVAYAQAGHLDHGYATTAHRAQGATVDQAFVLGSDELYREWGYTALTRHRHSARFYVTAAREFVNAPAQPLETGPDASRRVARLLSMSRAKRLALESDTAAAWSHPERATLVRAQDPLERVVSGLDRSRDRGLER
jgi:ATP-dependent exoDNAse (exonuclease V) alpha subunit